MTHAESEEDASEIDELDAEEMKLEERARYLYRHFKAVVIALDSLAFEYCKTVFDAKLANKARDFFWKGRSNPSDSSAPQDIFLFQAIGPNRTVAAKLWSKRLRMPAYLVGSGRRLDARSRDAVLGVERELLVGDALVVRQVCVGKALEPSCTLIGRENSSLSIIKLQPEASGRSSDRVHFCTEVDKIFAELAKHDPAVGSMIASDLNKDFVRNIPTTPNRKLVRTALGVVKDANGCSDHLKDRWIVEHPDAADLMEIMRKPERKYDHVVDVLSSVGVTQTFDSKPSPGANDLASLHSTVAACAIIRMTP